MSSGDEVSVTIAGVCSRTAILPTSLGRLSGRERTDLLELAVAEAEERFLRQYGPLRFNAGYARSELGYAVASSTRARKKREARRYADAILPNVFSGDTREAYLTQSRVETRAIGGRTSGRVQAIIRMPLPGYVNRQTTQVTNKCLRKITLREGQQIIAWIFDYLVAANSRMRWSTATRDGEIVPRATLASADAARVGWSSRATVIAQRASAAQGAPRG